LPFVHLNYIFKAFDLLRQESEKEFQPILDYFEEYYIGLKKGSNSKLKKKPLFLPAYWNVFERVATKSARSNNQIESWHKHFNLAIKPHPTILNFIARLRSEILLYEASVLHTNRGDDKLPPAAERRKSLRIEHVHADFLKFDLMDYLDNIVNAIDNEINVSKFVAVLDKYKEVDLEECEIF
jgi:hypothetical protein